MTNKKQEKKPRILMFDIETSHSLLAAFGIFNQNIPYTNVLGEWAVISIAWKWKDEKKTYSASSIIKKDKNSVTGTIDDKKLIEDFLKVLEEADIVVGHNIDKFDLKKLRTRAIYHGLTPFKKLYTVDTLKVARKEFAFTSNRLDYIAKYLGLKGKMSTPAGLWLDVWSGNQKALKTMVEYNIQDVIVLENVYKKLLPYMSSHPNINMFTEDTHSCPKCGSREITKHGKRYTKTGIFQRYICKGCGSSSRSKLADMQHRIKIVME